MGRLGVDKGLATELAHLRYFSAARWTRGEFDARAGPVTDCFRSPPGPLHGPPGGTRGGGVASACGFGQAGPGGSFGPPPGSAGTLPAWKVGYAPSGPRPGRALGPPSGAGRAFQHGAVLVQLAEESLGPFRPERRERVPAVQVVPAARGRRNREGEGSCASGDGDGGPTGFHDGFLTWNRFGGSSFRRWSRVRNLSGAFKTQFDRMGICRPSVGERDGGEGTEGPERSGGSVRGGVVNRGRGLRRFPGGGGSSLRRGRCSGSPPAGRGCRARASPRRDGSSPR